MTIHRTEKLSTKLVTDGDFHRTYTTVYQVIATTDENPFDVGSASELPAWNTTYKWDNGYEDEWAFARDYAVDLDPTIIMYKDEECYIWTVTITFDTKFNGKKADKRLDPVDDPVIATGSFSTFTRSVVRDRNNRIIMNTAYDQLAPETIDDSLDTLSIEFNTREINLLQRARMRNCVNSTEMWGLKRRQAKLASWTWRVGYAGKKEFINHRMEFQISYQEYPLSIYAAPGSDPKIGWYTLRPNAGFNEYIAKEGEVVPETTIDGVTPPTEGRKRKIKTWERQARTDSTNLDIKGRATETTSWLIFEVEPEANFLSIKGFPTKLEGPFKPS